MTAKKALVSAKKAQTPATYCGWRRIHGSTRLTPVGPAGGSFVLPIGAGLRLNYLDAVPIGIAQEADAVALGAAAGAVGRLFGLDALGGECLERSVEVVDREGDVVVAAAVVVGVDTVVVGQLEARVFAGQGHEDVDRLVADRHAPHLFEAERLVEGDRALDVADPVAGVQEGRHMRARLPACLQFATECRATRACAAAGRTPR